MKKNWLSFGVLGWLVPLIFFGSLMTNMSIKVPMWMDEYAFYRLSSGLPDYSSTSDWFFIDRPEVLYPSDTWAERGIDREEVFRASYDTLIYTHTPLPTILVWPAVKVLDMLADEGVISHIEDEYDRREAEFVTIILRFIPIVLFLLAMWLIYKLLRHKVEGSAYWFSVPVFASLILLQGAFQFYWDSFMMFFFVLTLYLMETKPSSKWQYVAACCLVNTKLFIGILFLLPLVIKNKKIALAGFSILPFYIATVVVTHDPFYVFMHYLNQTPVYSFIFGFWNFPEALLALWSLGMPFHLVMTVPILFLFRKYPVYVIYWIVTIGYAWGIGAGGIVPMSSILYAGALVVPLVVHKFRVVERVRNLLYTIRRPQVGIGK